MRTIQEADSMRMIQWVVLSKESGEYYTKEGGRGGHVERAKNGVLNTCPEQHANCIGDWREQVGGAPPFTDGTVPSDGMAQCSSYRPVLGKVR